jgi:site-specific recombinase XerD
VPVGRDANEVYRVREHLTEDEARVDTRTIQAYLGHKSIQHTVRYTELAPTRFKSLFRD